MAFMAKGCAGSITLGGDEMSLFLFITFALILLAILRFVWKTAIGFRLH